jgi:hypothetical protein
MRLYEHQLLFEQQPQEFVELNTDRYPGLVSAMLPGLSQKTVEGNDVVVVGANNAVVNVPGGIAHGHSDTTSFMRARFTNPFDNADFGPSLAFLIQFRMKTELPNADRQAIGGLGSNEGDVGNTLFIAAVDATNQICSLTGTFSSNPSWHYSGIFASDLQPHTVLLEGYVTSGGFTFVHREWCDGKVYNEQGHGGQGGRMPYSWLCSLGSRRSSDLTGELNAEVLMCAAFVFGTIGNYGFSREEAEFLCRNPYSIFKPKSIIVPYSDSAFLDGRFTRQPSGLYYGNKLAYLYQGRQYAGLPT